MNVLKKIGIWLGILVGVVTVAAFWTNIPTKNDMYRGDDNLQKAISDVDDNLQKAITKVEDDIQKVEDDIQKVEDNLQVAITKLEDNLQAEMKSGDAAIHREMQAIREEMNRGFSNITALFELYLQESKEPKADIRANAQNHVNHLEHHKELVSSERESQKD